MTIIASLLRNAQLPESPTERLDAELLLAAAIGKSRSYLHTWPERIVSSEDAETYAGYLQRRRGGEPVAYILGQQGFWTIDLEVAPHTLIPRPDTELLVETALELQPASPAKVLDLGTGTGAIALALASDRPAWQVTAVDRVEEAAALAERNRQRLGLADPAMPAQQAGCRRSAGQTQAVGHALQVHGADGLGFGIDLLLAQDGQDKPFVMGTHARLVRSPEARCFGNRTIGHRLGLLSHVSSRPGFCPDLRRGCAGNRRPVNNKSE